MSVLAVIPARYAATRFPGKPLAKLAGVEMIRRVYENCLAAESVDKVIVATDDQRIVDFVSAWGGAVQMTSAEHLSGTDRIAEVAAEQKNEVVLNMQGDEPLVTGVMLDQILAGFADSRAEMGTAALPLGAAEDSGDPNLVKVVLDGNGYALYFSRALIPHVRDDDVAVPFYRHLGIYVYRRDFLLAYPRLQRGMLEQAENLEQLRALENGHRIKVVLLQGRTQSVDVPEDVAKVEALLNKNSI